MKILFLGRGSRAEVCRKSLEGHEFVEFVDDADLIVMANHNKILPKEVFSRPKYGAINCHAGKLPEYRGSSVLNWQIINGETEGSVSIIQVDEGIDTGDILFEWGFLIGAYDTISIIRGLANERFQEMLPMVVHRIGIGAVSPIKQKGVDSYWHHRKPEDSLINWQTMTAKQVYDLVRATENPYQSWAYGKYKWLIDKAKLLGDNYYGIPGRVVRRIDNGVVVIAKDRGVWIEAELKVGEQLY